MKILKAAWPLLLPLCFMAGAQAGEIRPYDQKSFNELSAAGRPVLLHIEASWCPTCKAQKPVLSKLMAAPAYKDVTLMTIDFDFDKPLLQKYQVKMQSTLVAFKGSKEVGRSTAELDPARIEDLVKKTVH